MAWSDEDVPEHGKHPGLTFAQTEVNYILGTSLRAVYQDLLQQPVPDHLQALLDQMEVKSSARAQE
jgi:hypothetical protein